MMIRCVRTAATCRCNDSAKPRDLDSQTAALGTRVAISSSTTQLEVVLMDLLTWLIVGLVAGVLASLVMGGTGYGLIGDIVIGIAGAFVGGWVLRKLGTGVPVGGLAGVIIVAFIGAIVLLLILRIIRSATRGAP